MKNLNLITVLAIFITISLSCKKDDNLATSSDDSFFHCSMNAFLPIDTTKVWVYNKMVTTYDDVITDGIDETTTTNTNDTTTFSKVYLKEKYFTRKFNDSYYFTTKNSISVLLDSSFFLNEITFVTIAYTDKTQATWQQTINAKNATVTLTFSQSVNKDQFGNEIDDELLITIQNGEFLTLYQSYVFKKNVGLIKKRLDVMNTDIEYNLIKTI